MAQSRALSAKSRAWRRSCSKIRASTIIRFTSALAVVVTRSYEVRDTVRDRLQKVLDEQFPAVLSRVEPLQLGPPVDWPIQFRVGGSDIGMVRTLADQVSAAVAEN